MAALCAASGQFALLLDEAPVTDRTRILAFTHVSNVLGTVNPVRRIADLAHAAGAILLVDGAQGVPHLPVDVQALGADFYTASAHKMYGPTGVGFLYGRLALLDAMPPWQGGGGMIQAVSFEGTTFAPVPARFEAGTPPIAPAIALGAAIDYLNALGIDAVERHEHELARYAYERLQEIDGLKILGPSPEHRAGLVSFTVKQPHPHDVAQLLDQQGIAVRAGHHCTQPLHDRLGITASTRASFYLYNTPAEVDLLVDTVRQIQARFKPQGRQRRPKA